SCPPGHSLCSDGSVCVLTDVLCDGVSDCPDGSDESSSRCTTCDGQFVLGGSNGTFKSSETETYRNNSNCRWIIQEKLSCNFEQGFCFWRQTQENLDTWIRTNVPTFPPLTGPNFDHTFGNSSFYIVTSMSPGQWLKSFMINSLPLAPSSHPMCLSFYHMFGEDVYRLRVLLRASQPESTEVVLFHKEGNFGDNWNYGQITLNLTTETTVVFEAQKKGGMQNDIALDDISLTSEACGPAPPEPTNVPADCGGPFDLWEPNSTFASPNYPQSYGDGAELWTLHAKEGQNIQLHFLDFDVEATYDVVEVRDGAGPNSTLLVLSGSDGPAHDLYSTANQMTVWFYTDSGGSGRGFRANFTAPCAIGQFQCQTGACIHGDRQCDGVADCPDGYDEADCVCGDTWHPRLSDFICQYLGYETCSSGEVVSLNCSNQVVGGANAEKGAWPWMVSLHWRGRHACGASLISRDWLLTAAHCVYKNTHLQYWSAVLGLHAQSAMNSQEVQIRQVDRIIINKKYDRRTKEADIAMMHLQQPVNFTEGQHFPAGRRCFIAGWDVLQEAEVPLVDQEECQRLLPEYTFTSSMLCAGYPEGGVDSCQLTGVTSFGVGCGRPERPGAYARVSAFASWIAE
uniref:Transmembrane serine protease 15 n=1 Tax=Oryzias melastigma TaxID=30732 RepID=A0A3B3C1K1_ORYME